MKESDPNFQNKISTSLAHKIYKIYGKESVTKLKENPYGIVDDVYGVEFKTADLIAQKLGISNESYSRCRSGIFHILNQFASEGHIIIDYKRIKY